jgi:hypothetical protein
VFKGVLLGLCLVGGAAACAAQTPVSSAQQPQCIALEVPQQDSGVRVSATYGGQHYEFRVTVDGKPVDLQSQVKSQEVKAACVYTS